MTTENKKRSVFEIPASLSKQVDEADRALANGDTDVELDFSNCKFISVEGLEWLEELLLRAESSHNDVILKSVHPTVYKVFKVARIDAVLKACGSKASGPVC